ncbi:MAG: hypothetical protein ACJ77B_12880 [Chloroflexota bacterium]
MTPHFTLHSSWAVVSRPGWLPAVPLAKALAAATAVLLGVDACVHLSGAAVYDGLTTSPLGEGNLFRAQAIAAIVVAVGLLIRPRPIVWAVAAVVAGSAVAAVTLYTYVDIGASGPLPDLYQPTWALPGKVGSAVAETAATGLALAGFALARTSNRSAAASDAQRSHM